VSLVEFFNVAAGGSHTDYSSLSFYSFWLIGP